MLNAHRKIHLLKVPHQVILIVFHIVIETYADFIL